jgi:hypothetical protein
MATLKALAVLLHMLAEVVTSKDKGPEVDSCGAFMLV